MDELAAPRDFVFDIPPGIKSDDILDSVGIDQWYALVDCPNTVGKAGASAVPDCPGDELGPIHDLPEDIIIYEIIKHLVDEAGAYFITKAWSGYFVQHLEVAVGPGPCQERFVYAAMRLGLLHGDWSFHGRLPILFPGALLGISAADEGRLHQEVVAKGVVNCPGLHRLIQATRRSSLSTEPSREVYGGGSWLLQLLRDEPAESALAEWALDSWQHIRLSEAIMKSPALSQVARAPAVGPHAPKAGEEYARQTDTLEGIDFSGSQPLKEDEWQQMIGVAVRRAACDAYASGDLHEILRTLMRVDIYGERVEELFDLYDVRPGEEMPPETLVGAASLEVSSGTSVREARSKAYSENSWISVETPTDALRSGDTREILKSLMAGSYFDDSDVDEEEDPIWLPAARRKVET